MTPNPSRLPMPGETFYYRVKYSEYDQSGKDAMEQTGARINAKIVPYSIYNPVMVLNLVPMLILILLGSFFMERKLKKGIEAHESASGKTGDRKNNKQERQGKSGGSIAEQSSQNAEEGLGMPIDISTVMNSLFPAGTLLLALLLIFAAVLHINNLNRVHKLDGRPAA